MIATGDGSGNTTAPEDDPGFANVGIRGPASAVYLGNRWAITAAHVRPGSVLLSGLEYAVLPAETVPVENPTDDLTPETDLLLLRLAEDPGLPHQRLPCEQRRLGSEVVMVGYGHDREPQTTYWNVDVGPTASDDVWTEVASASEGNRQGFKTQDSQTIRWGRGSIGVTDFVEPTDDGDVISFSSSFNRSLNVDDLSQAVRGDSGGAVFQKNLGVWELVGVIYAVSPLENQPLGTRGAVYGDSTLIVDLHQYKDFIREVAEFESAPVDLNGDGDYSAEEIDTLFAIHEFGEFASCHFDVDQNGTVNSLDVEAFLELPQILPGDADRDGIVGFSDFLAVSRTFGKESNGWASGDFNGDGQVNFADFLTFSGNFGESVSISQGNASLSVASVPEPEQPRVWLILLPLVLHLVCRRRRQLQTA